MRLIEETYNKKEKEKEKENLLKDTRTIFSLNDTKVNIRKHFIGLITYIIIFVLLIPYFLYKFKFWNVLTAYFPNLDLIATVLGFDGGPMNTDIWLHLYNPSDTTIIGYITSNLINLFALSGLIFVVILYSLKKNNVYAGLARALIMLPLTYFIPSNIIAFNMLKFHNTFINLDSNLRYFLSLIVGLTTTLIFIILEAIFVEHNVKWITELLEYVYKKL